ncbi:MAG TPA: aldose 1-epimerase family protein [Rhizomicrobium sp.]|jgi:galactose mutarotase-like enzyme
MSESDALIAIRAEGLSAAINPLGAELSLLRDSAGRDLLWNGDPAVWSGRAPLLFPVVGELAGGSYRLAGKVYHLPRHGFARRKTFKPVETEPSTAVFRLTSDETTFPVYPFRFELDVRFAAEERKLTLSATIRNIGTDEMPASFGFHPALRWPLPYNEPRAAHTLQFEQDEPAPVRRLDKNGTILCSQFASPVEGRSLLLRDDLFKDDAVIFDQIESRSLRYGAEHGPRVRVDFSDTPYLGVWSKPGAEFVCIEPWHGCADPEGYSGDFRDKPGVFVVPAGGEKWCTMSLTLCDAG